MVNKLYYKLSIHIFCGRMKIALTDLSQAPPAIPATTTTTATSPSSDEPFFPELSLPPPVTQTPPPSSTPGLANGSLPVTVNSGRAGPGTAKELHPSAGLVAGLAIGGALLLVVFVLLWFICCRGKGKRVKSNPEKDHYGTQSSSGIKGKRGQCTLSSVVFQKLFPLPR